MSKFTRAAQTSQSLSLAAMEEASRMGRREADIDHMFLALVISDQSAGRVLREIGIDLDAARLAVEEQHEAQLASLGIDASFPAPGRIVFQETDGYQWSKRASDLIARSGGKEREGDAAAVLRELVIEPSGLILDILQRLGTTPAEVMGRLDHADATLPEATPRRPQEKGRVSGTTEAFVPASVDQVWEFLTDPSRVPDWEVSVGSIDATDESARPGMLWQGRAPQARPDGKPLKIKPQFHRRTIELVKAEQPAHVVWQFTYPDATHRGPTLTTFDLASTAGGTQVTITTSWARSTGWRRIVGLPMRPLLKFVIWIGLFQTGSAISRAFR
ncbi:MULTISPECIES: SRPBCC family protein [Microbacteriaceae]|uniref:SRPBCC family protein n=1 Tax=Microbacteriaceae TaxID=85023 RepID=UPI000B36040E|nr:MULTISPECIES: Clp protease N-terminal domain-containing protein [Microbacteriaceae]MBG0717205.1 Clp protease [Microbacterium paulum]